MSKIQDIAPVTPQSTDKVGISRTNGTTAITATLQSIADLGAVGNAGEIQFKGTGFDSTTDLVWDGESLHIGTPIALPDNPLSVQGTVDSYLQTNIQNSSDGTSASSDIVLTADDGDDTVNYLDIGISSSTYADPAYPLTDPHDSYIWANGGDMVIGTMTPGKEIKLHTDGVGLDSLRATISDQGLNLTAGTWITLDGYPIPLNPGLWIEGGISDGSTANKVIVAANRGTFLSNVSNKLETYILPEIELDITDDQTTFILANYNSQSFIVSSSNTANYTTILPYAEIFKRSGSTARHTQISTILSNGEATAVFQKDQDAEKYTIASGFDGLAISGSLGISLNGGVVYAIHTKYTIPAVTVATRNFYPVKGTDGWYYTGRSGTTPTINATYWNDTTELGVNAAVALTAGYWTVSWLYRGCEGEDHLYMIAGQAEYATSALALAVTQPTDADLPDMVTSHAFFVGRVVIQQGDTTGATAIIDGEYDNVFNKHSSIKYNRTFGTGANNTTFEEDGTMVASGDAKVWKDIIIAPSALGAGASAPNLVNFLAAGGLQILAFDGGGTTEQLYGSFEMQHDYAQGTDLDIHIHWCPTTAAAGTVKWQFEYSIANMETTFPATTTIFSTVNTDSTAWKHHYDDIGAAISGTGLQIGHIVMFRLFRIPTEDTYPDDAGMLSIGVHYECDTLGSRTETQK